MSVKEILEFGSRSEIISTVEQLTTSGNDESLSALRDSLLDPSANYHIRDLTAALAPIALLQQGIRGVEILKELVVVARRLQYRAAIFEALWYASRGELSPVVNLHKGSTLLGPFSTETKVAAHNAITELVTEAIIDGRIFDAISQFLTRDYFFNQKDESAGEEHRKHIFETLTSGVIKVTPSLIGEFENLINKDYREEIYQNFLSQHPVFLDPLASEVIPKHKLGSEFVTDFVVQRYDGRYIVVEIEKPQDALFTASNNFTADFTHAFGQILDFQQWIGQHTEYARSKLPEISLPAGLLVMGRRSELSIDNVRKLASYNLNSARTEVVTFDDLLIRTNNLYKNIYKKAHLV